MVHEMRRFNANQLHKSIVDDWVDWVHSATTSGVECWDNNTFLKENVPLAISVRYGKNQRVCQTNTCREEAEHWHRIHKYYGMRSIMFALATHIQYVPLLHQLQGVSTWFSGPFQ